MFTKMIAYYYHGQYTMFLSCFPHPGLAALSYPVAGKNLPGKTGKNIFPVLYEPVS
jgi:hypothetical protein